MAARPFGFQTSGKSWCCFLSQGRYDQLHGGSHRLYPQPAAFRQRRRDSNRRVAGQRQEPRASSRQSTISACRLCPTRSADTHQLWRVVQEEHVRPRLHGRVRTTFLIDRAGVIARIWRNVRVRAMCRGARRQSGRFAALRSGFGTSAGPALRLQVSSFNIQRERQTMRSLYSLAYRHSNSGHHPDLAASPDLVDSLPYPNAPVGLAARAFSLCGLLQVCRPPCRSPLGTENQRQSFVNPNNV